jgi:lipoprotein-anchoring transpeptidase ErfK/SrfK
MLETPAALSRRDFLKLSSAGLLGLLLTELQFDYVLAAEAIKEGRAALSGISIYEAPSFNAKQIDILNRDQVVPITAEVAGDDETAYNRLWYCIENNGYAYSGWIQPVKTVFNSPVYDIPPTGILGEITIPFVAIRQQPNSLYRTGFRLYYGSTHWIQEIVINKDDETIWYRLDDEPSQVSYFIPAEAVRISTAEELTLLSPDIPNELKSIYVDLAGQTVMAFEDEKPVLMSRLSSGTKGTRTPSGSYRTYHKSPTVHMSDGDDGKNQTYDLPGVPWVTFFTGTGVSFHGTYWHNDFGHPRSHGCINLPLPAAKFIYRWTLPTVPPQECYLHKPGEGTNVQIGKI